MGGLARIQEKLKQAIGLGQGNTKEWKPTSNARNIAMIKEARRFAHQLKTLHHDLASLSAGVEASLVTVKTVLAASLPRAFDEGPLGAEPVDQGERLVGINVNLAGIEESSTEMQQRLQAEVLGPLEQWLSCYRSIKERNKKVELLRLDLDTKRRSTLAVHDRYIKQKESGHKETEQTYHKLQTEEDKLSRLGQRYAETEAEVFNALLTLIRDTAVLREYAAAALAILQRCFTLAYSSFDFTTPVPLPALPPLALLPQLEQTSASGGGSSVNRSVNTSRAATTSSGGGLPAGSHMASSGMVRAPPSPNHTERIGETPGQGSGAPEAAQPPAWYTAARNRPAPMQYSSDDEGSGPSDNPFAAGSVKSNPVEHGAKRAASTADADNPFAH